MVLPEWGLEASLVHQYSVEEDFVGMSVLVFRHTLEIPVRDYTAWSNRVRPYDFKAPIIDLTLCHELYMMYCTVYTILLYTVDHILYTWSIYIR